MPRQRTRQYAFRLSEDLIRRIDVYAARLQASLPQVRVTRSMALRTLLADAVVELDPLDEDLRRGGRPHFPDADRSRRP